MTSATKNGLRLGTLIAALGTYQDAKLAATGEAQAVTSLSRTALQLPALLRDDLDHQLVCYGRDVITYDWTAATDGTGGGALGGVAGHPHRLVVGDVVVEHVARVLVRSGRHGGVLGDRSQAGHGAVVVHRGEPAGVGTDEARHRICRGGSVARSGDDGAARDHEGAEEEPGDPPRSPSSRRAVCRVLHRASYRQTLCSMVRIGGSGEGLKYFRPS